MLALIDAGLDVSVPFGENCRCDLVIDRAGRLTRAQGLCISLLIEDVGTRSGAYLRVEPPLSGQRRRIRYARDYEIALVECVALAGVALRP